MNLRIRLDMLKTMARETKSLARCTASKALHRGELKLKLHSCLGSPNHIHVTERVNTRKAWLCRLLTLCTRFRLRLFLQVAQAQTKGCHA
jgi:hypothetical protein